MVTESIFFYEGLTNKFVVYSVILPVKMYCQIQYDSLLMLLRAGKLNHRTILSVSPLSLVLPK